MPGPAARSYMGGSVIEQPKAIIPADDSRLRARMPPADVAIESELPASLPPGRPTALFLEGRAPGVREIELIVGGERHRPAAQRMPRFDLHERCGWWAVLPVPAGTEGGAIEIAARADGQHVSLGRIPVVGGLAHPSGSEDGLRAAADALIAVCMATYEPDPELFARQVQSL